mgnify:CR=1 FL=1
MKIEELDKPLDRAAVKSRSQGNFNLSYIEGWWAISEANRIFGFDGWDRATMYNKEVSRIQYMKGTIEMFKVGYEAKVDIRVFTKDGEVNRTGTGHGSQVSKDLFDAIEGAAKEAETDAMKRALMTFGNPFGLALYDKTQKNVQIAPEPIRQESVDWAVNQYKEIIMADNEEVDFLKMQAIDHRLSNDERIAVSKGLGDETYSSSSSSKGRLFRTLVADYLKMKPEDLLNKDDFFDANFLDGDK